MFEKGCKPGPGRPRTKENNSQISTIIECGAIKAAQYIRDLADGEIKKPSAVRLDACKYLINQAIGMPKQRNENTNDGTVKLLIEYANGDRREIATPEPEGTTGP